MQIRLILAMGGLGLLAACGTNPQRPSPNACSMSAHQSLIGQNIGAVTLPSELPHRIISPGQPVTMDYNPQRLNVHVDDKGWIGKVDCG